MSMLEHSVRKVFAFALSFVVIGAQWLSHVRNMHLIRRADSTFLLLNLLMLMVVCFLPYPTAVLGEIGPNRLAVTFYAGTVALLAVAELLIWLWAAYGGHLLADSVTAAAARMIAIRQLVPIVVFGASIAIAQVNPRWAMWSWIAIAPLLMLTRLLRR